MQQIKPKHLITLIVLSGAFMRVFLGIYSPPTNSFDDHLEPISHYINNNERPLPNTCWECYQPPLYYVLSAAVFKSTFAITKSYFYSWKFVQFINIIFSILNLIIISKILNQIKFKNKLLIPLVISIIAFLPKDIYSSVMITNDYILVFLTSLSIYYFLKYLNIQSTSNLLRILLVVFLGAISKQHGLILSLIPLYIIYKSFFKEKTNIIILLPLITLLLMCSDEIWKYGKTGIWLVSNQDFFKYASSQLPGNIFNVSFYNIQFIELIKNPFLSQTTLSSFWTEVFARTWFDYEWRFLTPGTSNVNIVSTILYSIGTLITFTPIFIALKYWRKIIKIKNEYRILILIGLLFLFVPIFQTFRFPYYSSMKSQFILPAISIFAMILYWTLLLIKIQTNIIYLTIFTLLIVGISHTLFITENIGDSLPNLSGPLWNFPHIN